MLHRAEAFGQGYIAWHLRQTPRKSLQASRSQYRSRTRLRRLPDRLGDRRWLAVRGSQAE